MIAGKDGAMTMNERIDGVDYELYRTVDGGAVRVYDADSGNLVTIVTYPKYFNAAMAYDQCLARLRS